MTGKSRQNFQKKKHFHFFEKFDWNYQLFREYLETPRDSPGGLRTSSARTSLLGHTVQAASNSEYHDYYWKDLTFKYMFPRITAEPLKYKISIFKVNVLIGKVSLHFESNFLLSKQNMTIFFIIDRSYLSQ